MPYIETKQVSSFSKCLTESALVDTLLKRTEKWITHTGSISPLTLPGTARLSTVR